MIAEFTAAMAAIKETASLAKVISDAKTEAEINAAVGDMVSKLTSVQRECMTLIELARSYQEETIALKGKIADFEDFKSQAEGYALHKTEAGTLVYSKNQVVGDAETMVNLCPHCFQQNKISILQPTGDTSYDVHTGKYCHQSRCHCCNSLYLMNTANYKPVDTVYAC